MTVHLSRHPKFYSPWAYPFWDILHIDQCMNACSEGNRHSHLSCDYGCNVAACSLAQPRALSPRGRLGRSFHVSGHLSDASFVAPGRMAVNLSFFPWPPCRSAVAWPLGWLWMPAMSSCDTLLWLIPARPLTASSKAVDASATARLLSSDEQYGESIGSMDWRRGRFVAFGQRSMVFGVPQSNVVDETGGLCRSNGR